MREREREGRSEGEWVKVRRKELRKVVVELHVVLK